ncbi:HD domain-containing protein [Pseudomonas aeruginosa]
MEFFRVGGCVRDMVLGIEPQDIDYVVVGESPSSMLELGFKQVGEHTPVFLHPLTGDEYALARRERSTGNGHNDFAYEWCGVSLVEDLFRRDVTINAMAIGPDGELIDPYGGLADLKSGTLRHVGPAFAEDPLRILRVARFAAKLGFAVAPETVQMMREMVDAGMLVSDQESDAKIALSAERLWAETNKALQTKNPRRYFEVLDSCGALDVLFPEVSALKKAVQRVDYHAEGDSYIHTLMVLDEAAALTEGMDEERLVRIRFAALVHDLGKAKTPHELLYHEDGTIKGAHPGHEDPNVFEPELKRLSRRLKVPSRYVKFAHTMTEVHQGVHAISATKERGLVRLYDRLGGRRRLEADPNLLEDIGIACYADSLGRRYLKEGELIRPTHYPQKDYFKRAMLVIDAIDVGSIMKNRMDEKGMSVEEAKHEVSIEQWRVARGFFRAEKEGIDFPR